MIFMQYLFCLSVHVVAVEMFSSEHMLGNRKLHLNTTGAHRQFQQTTFF